METGFKWENCLTQAETGELEHKFEHFDTRIYALNLDRGLFNGFNWDNLKFPLPLNTSSKSHTLYLELQPLSISYFKRLNVQEESY